MIAGAAWLAWPGSWRPAPRVAHVRLPHAAYLWQRQWTVPVRAAATAATAESSPLDELLVFGAEIVVTGPREADLSVVPVGGLDWTLLAHARRPVGVVVRVRGPQGVVDPQGPAVAALRQTLDGLCARARQAGLKLAEVQVDFDCPTSRLREFARVLAALRRERPAEHWTFTALPAWLHSPAFGTLARAADGYVLQVHSFETGGRDHRPPATLCNPARARQAVERAARLGVPFRVALPTYSYRLVLDAQGTLLAAAAEGASLEQAQPPAGGKVRRLEADAPALARLVAGWREERPAALQGVVWYRLPVPGADRLNWSPGTLAAVMAGREPRPHLVAELAPPGESAPAGGGDAALLELRLRNTGEGDAPLPPTLRVRCAASPLAAEGIGAYEVTTGSPGEVDPRLVRWQRRAGDAGRRLPPGGTLPCGWLRLPDGPQEKPAVVLPVGAES